MRNSLSLAGTWQFQLDPGGVLTPQTLSPDREISVPLPWQVAFPDLQSYSGYAWYRRSVGIKDEWLGGELLLRFGAVDYWCRVFVNGQVVGEHEGGYTEFEVSITGQARPGSNEIVVQVYDSAQSGLPINRWPAASQEEAQNGPPFDARDIPHGKQEWYINVGGIWQDVELLAVPKTYLDCLHVSTDIASGQAKVRVELGGAQPGNDAGSLTISARAGGEEAGQARVPLVAGQSTYDAAIAVENPRLWSPEDPYLYTLTVSLQASGGEDQLSSRFGFREISTANGQILLNGEPLFLLCALDQDLYPDTIYTVPSEEFLRDQFRKARHLGLNSLRCHIKPPDPRYLELADEMGLLVWAEIPSWRTFHFKPTLFPEQLALGDTIKLRVQRTLEEMVRRDFNHPSLIIWTIVNEDWGTSLPLSASDREWVAQMYEHCKQLDPTRLVVDNSACPHPWGPNLHVHSDLDDFHMYANIPDHARNFEQSIDQFGLRPLWTYSNHGDATRTGKEPLVLSEFGNWGLPSNKSLRAHYNGDPGWFNLDAWWAPWEGEAAYPKDTEKRFRALGLDAIWGNYESFAEATQWHQFHAMKFEIEAMRRQPALAGYVITEFTDAYWESNGLLDFVRNPKAYYDRFAEVNSPDMVIPRVARYAYWDDQEVSVQLALAHYSRADWTGALLRWRIEGGDQAGEQSVPALSRGEVGRLRAIYTRLPTVGETTVVTLSFAIQGAGGAELARNSIELVVLPAVARQASYEGDVALVTSEDVLAEEPPPVPGLSLEITSTQAEAPASAETPPAASQIPQMSEGPLTIGGALRDLGYNTSRQITPGTQVAVSNYPNARLLQWVRDGGSLLFISDGPSPFFWTQHRSGAYSGSWISSFSWLRTSVHRRLKVSNPLGMAFMNCMPRMTILGVPYDSQDVQPDFLSGMISGWVHHPSVHTIQFRYGRGRVIMTVFALETGLRLGDPVATAMLHDLLEYLCSDECRPTLAANY